MRLRVALLALVVAGCSTSYDPPTAGAPAPLTASESHSWKERVLDRFTSPTYKGNRPSPLTPDGAGNYYGTTTAGGLGYGTLYELSRKGTRGWKETVLHAFQNYLDGGFPAFTPLIVDRRGDVYGTTQEGGVNQLGVAFRFHRTAHGWVESVLHNFGNGDAYPFNSLVMDRSGNLYGTDNVYHDGGGITEGVYEIGTSKGGSYQIIYDLGIAASNGVSGGLVMDANEDIFGISSGFLEPAIVFELQRTSAGWSPTVLFTFADVGIYPTGPPVLHEAGNIYSTTQGGGPHKKGSVYQLKRSRGGRWKMKTLYAFTGGTDGSEPYAGIAFDHRGNIYGTTVLGGAFGSGTVFELTAGSRAENVLWSFDGKDGSEPLAPIVADDAGNLFGTTSSGGGGSDCYAAAGCGNAFELSAAGGDALSRCCRGLSCPTATKDFSATNGGSVRTSVYSGERACAEFALAATVPRP